MESPAASPTDPPPPVLPYASRTTGLIWEIEPGRLFIQLAPLPRWQRLFPFLFLVPVLLVLLCITSALVVAGTIASTIAGGLLFVPFFTLGWGAMILAIIRMLRVPKPPLVVAVADGKLTLHAGRDRPLIANVARIRSVRVTHGISILPNSNFWIDVETADDFRIFGIKTAAMGVADNLQRDLIAALNIPPTAK